MNEKRMRSIGSTARVCAVSAALVAAGVSDESVSGRRVDQVRQPTSHQATDLREALDDREPVLDLGDFDRGARVVGFDDVKLACCNAEPLGAGGHGT